MPLFEAHGDDYGLARAWRLRSEVGRLVCRFGEEAAALERARVHAEAAGEERESVEIKLWLANCLCYGPTPVGDALAQTAELLDQAHGVRWVQASLLGMRGYLLAMADRPEEARTLHARSHAIFEELGMSFANVARAVIPAGIEQMAGDLEAAERELVSGHDQLEAIERTSCVRRSRRRSPMSSTSRAGTSKRRGSRVPARVRPRRTTSARRCCGDRRSPRSSRGVTALTRQRSSHRMPSRSPQRRTCSASTAPPCWI